MKYLKILTLNKESNIRVAIDLLSASCSKRSSAAHSLKIKNKNVEIYMMFHDLMFMMFLSFDFILSS